MTSIVMFNLLTTGVEKYFWVPEMIFGLYKYNTMKKNYGISENNFPINHKIRGILEFWSHLSSIFVLKIWVKNINKNIFESRIENKSQL